MSDGLNQSVNQLTLAKTLTLDQRVGQIYYTPLIQLYSIWNSLFQLNLFLRKKDFPQAEKGKR